MRQVPLHLSVVVLFSLVSEGGSYDGASVLHHHVTCFNWTLGIQTKSMNAGPRARGEVREGRKGGREGWKEGGEGKEGGREDGRVWCEREGTTFGELS